MLCPKKKIVDSLVAEGCPDRVTLRVLTWNVGNAPPPEDFTDLLGSLEGVEMVILGLQECRYDVEEPLPVPEYLDKTEARLFRRLTDFMQRVQIYCGESFRPAATEILGQMQLGVFLRTTLLPLFRGLQAAVEATGLGNVVSNKGGIVTRFQLGPKVIGLVSSHLAAHEGQQFCERRNADIAEIMRGAFKFGSGRKDVANRFDHTLWMGDLNYRLDPSLATSDIPQAPEEFWQFVVDLVQKEEWAKLLEMDELRHHIQSGNCLLEFQEGAIQHPPTFKVERQAGLHYQRQRVPAYCDRILWSSVPGMRDALMQVSLEALPAVPTSDHKPVRADFRLNLPVRPSQLQRPLSMKQGKRQGLQLKLSSLSLRNLPKDLDFHKDPDPYVIFMSRELFGSQVTFKSAVRKNTLEPDYKPEELPVMRTLWSDPALVTHEHVILLVMDRDRVTADDVVGFASLSLQGLTLDTPLAFSLELSKYGRRRGRISGCICLKRNARVSVV
eukprot:m.180996 g.180996  ORF g.180996 m.180996 type:complete len:498 (-) comp21476_c0_seq7:42-1535(-)